ncbi:claudin-6-like [Parambassis ranga]|uniref:Claudin-6-like n=1 Tax=Parambassis ranga TaxID=210632 RepID=A0A6P7JM02_9TELE|nr:claudin-6-like [Parambassis ranga]
MTTDIQAGHALTLISIIVGFLGFLVSLLSGVVASGDPLDLLDPPPLSCSFLGSALPTWKGTVVRDNSAISMVAWEGLWKMWCSDYPEWILPEDIKAARALIVIAIIVEVFGIVLSVIGSKYTLFVEEERHKYKAAIASGIIFIVAGLFVFIAVCWTTHTITQNDYKKRQLGAAGYYGWFTAVLLFLGGGFLCRVSRQD